MSLIECIFIQHDYEPIACEGDDALMIPRIFMLKCQTRIHDLAVALSKRHGGYWQFWEYSS